MAKRRPAPLDHDAAKLAPQSALPPKDADAAFAALQPAATRQGYPDKALPGLLLQTMPSGIKSWALHYRTDAGRQVKMTLGRFPFEMSTEQARAKAASVRSAVREGCDPAADAKARQQAALAAAEASKAAIKREADGGDRVGSLLTIWIADCVRRGNRVKTLREVHRAAARMNAAWGTRRVTEVTRSDIKAMIDIIGQDAPIGANRFFSLARSFFGFCLDHDIEGAPVLDASPAASIKKSRLFPETSRSRVLTDAEICTLWRATAPLETFHRAVRILLLIPAFKEYDSCLRVERCDSFLPEHFDSGGWE
jgi:hypothetical protein